MGNILQMILQSMTITFKQGNNKQLMIFILATHLLATDYNFL